MWIYRSLGILLTFFSVQAAAQQANYGNGLPATDALGRKLLSSKQAGLPRKDKFVGLFYWTWHTRFAAYPAYNTTHIVKANAGAATNYNHPAWPKNVPDRDIQFFWDEPLFGYYRNTDKWVLRKHAEMLADAGVDVIIFDCTNGAETWKESYTAVCEAFAEARNDGVNTPQIAFMLGFAPSPDSRAAIGEIYNDLYKPGRYKNLWFYWKGKPLIMAYPEMLGDVSGNNKLTAKNREMRAFFTFRPGQPVYNKGPERNDHWGWLEIAPQHGFAKTEGERFEQATVGVAQNWSEARGLTAMNAPGSFGRSYTHKYGENTQPGAVNYGYNFQEQWDNAIKINPEFIFITGWNEWVAGRYSEWNKQENAFPDEFSAEKSRDVEPMKGGHGDNYYYQMVNNIRRFKGVPAPVSIYSRAKINIDGSFTDWEKITGFTAYRGNTIHRDSPGWGTLHYRDTSGRNDITNVKVAHDAAYIYFYAETAAPLSRVTGKAWMRLYIDIDRDKNTGWEGYDYILNRESGNGETLLLEKSAGKDWQWQKIGDISYSVSGSRLELKIPRQHLKTGKMPCFEFKWTDNQQHDDDIIDFYLSGDSAPLGRFNYLYKK